MAKLDPVSTDFASKNPAAFARVLGRGEPAEIVRILHQLPPSIAASVVSRLTSSRASTVLEIAQESIPAWLAEATYDDALALLGKMPRQNCLALVNSLQSRDRRRKLLQFLKYPTHSVGTLVSDVLVRLPADMQATDALQELRALPDEEPAPIVVLRADGRYLGVLNLWRLFVRNPPEGTVGEYVRDVPALLPEVSISSAAVDPIWNRNNWLPVVDHEQRLLGGVTRERVIAYRADISTPSSGSEMIANMAVDMIRVFSAMLDRVLGGGAVR